MGCKRIRQLFAGMVLAVIAIAACAQQDSASDALFAAIAAEDLGAARTALANGASLRAFDKYGDTPLTAAAAQGNARLFSLLAGPGADLNARDRNGRTPLIVAVSHRQIDVARVLLQLGADVNADDITGRSAVFYTGSDTGTMALVLSAHPDLRQTDRDGRSVLGEQAFSSHDDIARMLVEAGASYTSVTDALYGAAAAGNVKIMDGLLSQGANPNGFPGSYTNTTPLMMAAFHDNIAAVRDLLAHGADPEIADSNAQDSLHWACSSHDMHMVEEILQAMHNLNGSRATFNRTAVMTTVRFFDDPGLVRRLLAAGVDVNARDREGTTALMDAAETGHRRDLGALLDGGADPTLRDHMHRTAADYAHLGHHDDLAAVLERLEGSGVPRRR